MSFSSSIGLCCHRKLSHWSEYARSTQRLCTVYFPFPSSLAYHCTRTPRAKDSELFEIDNLNDKVNTVNNAKFSASTYAIARSDTFPNSPCTALLVHRTISGAIDEAVRVRAAAELSLPALELQHLPQIYLRPPGNLQPPQPSEY